PPAAELYVIREGSVELRHQDEVVDILEPGEIFGHPSLLTSMASAFTVRAHEDTTCSQSCGRSRWRFLAGLREPYSSRAPCASGLPAPGIPSMAFRRFARFVLAPS